MSEDKFPIDIIELHEQVLDHYPDHAIYRINRIFVQGFDVIPAHGGHIFPKYDHVRIILGKERAKKSERAWMLK